MATDAENNASAAAALCRLCAPHDLEDLAAYVVPHSVAADFDQRLCMGNCLGWTMPALDMVLRPLLKGRGEWSGRGFACIWRDDVLADDFIPAAVALHELAHWLDSDIFFNTVDEQVFDLALPTWGVDQLPAKCARPDYDLQAEKTQATRRPWVDHELRFIRAALHLHRRAEVLGLLLPLGAMNFAGLAHGVSPAEWYAVALDDELSASTALPLLPLLRSPAPPLAVRLFSWDTTDASDPYDGAEYGAIMDELQAVSRASRSAASLAAVTPYAKMTCQNGVGPPEGGRGVCEGLLAHFPRV